MYHTWGRMQIWSAAEPCSAPVWYLRPRPFGRWQASPALYAANIAPKLQVSINIGHRQHDEDSGYNPLIIHAADHFRIGSNWWAIDSSSPLCANCCVVCCGVFSSMRGFCVFEFLRRQWYKKVRTTFWQKRSPAQTQSNDHNFVKTENQSKSFWEQLRRCILNNFDMRSIFVRQILKELWACSCPFWQLLVPRDDGETILLPSSPGWQQ